MKGMRKGIWTIAVLHLVLACKDPATAEKCTVTYKVYDNGGWTVMSNVKVEKDGEFDDAKVPDNEKVDFSGRKYRFAGWTTKDLSSENPSTATGQSYSGAVVSDMTVYALYSWLCEVDYKCWDGSAWVRLGEPEYVEPNSAFVRTKRPNGMVVKCAAASLLPPKSVYDYAFQFREDSWTDADVSEKTAKDTTSIVTPFSGNVTRDMTVYAIYDQMKDFVYVEKGKSPTKEEALRTDSDYLPMDYDFLICDHEVTQAEYKLYSPVHAPNFTGDDLPVEKVSWYDAVEYCNWLSDQEGLAPYYAIDKTKSDPNNGAGSDAKKWLVTINENANGYRLPLEWEWEYAMRGGAKGHGYAYSGSNEIEDVAWYYGNSGDTSMSGSDYIATQQTHEVKTKAANELGLYDMNGNVYEWCWNWYRFDSDGGMAPDEGPASGSNRVSRGGSWRNYADVSHRFGGVPDYSDDCVGFRVARSLPLS